MDRHGVMWVRRRPNRVISRRTGNPCRLSACGVAHHVFGASSWLDLVVEDREFLCAHKIVPLVVEQAVSGNEVTLAKLCLLLLAAVLHSEFAAQGVAWVDRIEERARRLHNR